MSLIEYRFSRNAPSNFYKEPPFEPGGNFVRPIDACLANVDWVLRRARERGLLVLLVRCYLGIDGGSELLHHHRSTSCSVRRGCEVEDIHIGGYEIFAYVAERLPRFIEEIYMPSGCTRPLAT